MRPLIPPNFVASQSCEPAKGTPAQGIDVRLFCTERATALKVLRALASTAPTAKMRLLWYENGSFLQLTASDDLLQSKVNPQNRQLNLVYVPPDPAKDAQVPHEHQKELGAVVPRIPVAHELLDPNAVATRCIVASENGPYTRVQLTSGGVVRAPLLVRYLDAEVLSVCFGPYKTLANLNAQSPAPQSSCSLVWCIKRVFYGLFFLLVLAATFIGALHLAEEPKFHEFVKRIPGIYELDAHCASRGFHLLPGSFRTRSVSNIVASIPRDVSTVLPPGDFLTNLHRYFRSGIASVTQTLALLMEKLFRKSPKGVSAAAVKASKSAKASVASAASVARAARAVKSAASIASAASSVVTDATSSIASAAKAAASATPLSELARKRREALSSLKVLGESSASARTAQWYNIPMA